jgi:putative ABC transport system ATP-binding protein
MALIQLQQVWKLYGKGENEVAALKNVNLTVEKGEFLSIVGKSGSGKSTLMNLLGCLDTPSRGTYRLDGEAVGKMSERKLTDLRRKKIGFVFQGFHLVPGITAWENVALPLLYRGMPRRKRLDLAAEALERVGLGHRMGHEPNQLSGGQQQRVAVARALVTDPELLLADEPTGNLDSASGQEVMRLICGLPKEGKTVVLITHDPRIAELGDRSLEIRDGVLR